ncbi:MAG: S8 family serine peptidase, partial [Flavobacteriales bacterium]
MKQGISRLQRIQKTMKYIVLTLILAAFHLDIQAQHAPTVFGEVLVQLRPNTSLTTWLREAQTTLGIDAHLEYKSTVSEHMRIHLLSFNEQRIDKRELIRELQHVASVSCVQANHILSERIVPDDPFFSMQWHHQQANDSDIDSDLAWDITTGGTTASGIDIVVCVVEIGGAQWNTSDISDNHWVNEAEIPGNGVDDDGNGYVDDYHGWNINTQNDIIAAGDHGTRVSSMIGSTGNNSTGVVGLNWDVKMMQVQIGSSTEAAAIAGYEYPLKMRRLFQMTQGDQGAFVVATNSSWGTDNGQPADAPLWCAMYDSLGYYGIISCASTTNNNSNVDAVGDLPTACPSDFLIAVGRSNSSDVRASGGYGINTIDLVAPGDNVYLANNTQYVSTTGTSFSSPCVAGGVALLYSAPCLSIETQALADPAWTAQQVRSYILDGVDATQQLIQETASGGRFNVNNSLQLLLQQCENGSCLQPYNLSVQLDSVGQYTLAWNTIATEAIAEIRYRNSA